MGIECMLFNKKLAIIFLIIIAFFLAACSNEGIDSKSPSPRQNKIDSLSFAKNNKAVEAAKLRQELDSLQKHLDSIKSIQVDSAK